MARLFLLRHAKAAWAAPGMRDFDRALDDIGRRDAIKIGRAMRDAELCPSDVLCSTARRARETWEGVRPSLALPETRVERSEALYSMDAAGYMRTVQSYGEASDLMLVGHNPMIEDVALALARDGDPRLLAELATGFPTCGLAVISFPGSLAKAAPGLGTIETFLAPAPR